MSVLVHSFKRPLPYSATWALQEKIHRLQLSLRPHHPDVLLVLEHRPVYTAGRRQSDAETAPDRLRLQQLGADFVTTTRGGQLTYHGPGQLVVYPLLDLSRYSPTLGAKDYVCRIQTVLTRYLHSAHGVRPFPSTHTGVFLGPDQKIASIGVAVRHRLTSHGFAINITDEPLPWFNQIVACGLQDVSAASVQSAAARPLVIEHEIPLLLHHFADVFDRQLRPVDPNHTDEISQAILELERDSELAPPSPRAPTSIP